MQTLKLIVQAIVIFIACAIWLILFMLVAPDKPLW